MEIKLIVSTNDADKKSICEAYWKLDGMEKKYQFSKELKYISDKYNLTIQQVSKIAKNHSELRLKCDTCSDLFVIENITDWNKIISKLDFFEGICKKCKTKKQNSKGDDLRKKLVSEKYFKMEKALKTKRWEAVSLEHLEILIIIAELKLTKTINKELFRPWDKNNHFIKDRWDKINKLQSLNLLWVERTENGSVKQFHMLNKLKKILLNKFPNEFLKKKNLFKNSKIEIRSDITYRKSGIVKGEFLLENDFFIKRMTPYNLSVTLDLKNNAFTTEIESK